MIETVLSNLRDYWGYVYEVLPFVSVLETNIGRGQCFLCLIGRDGREGGTLWGPHYYIFPYNLFIYIFFLHHSLVSVEKWSYFYQSILIKVLTDV